MSDGIAANTYLSNVTKRRKLLCEANEKLGVLRLLINSIGKANRTLVFSETIQGSGLAYSKLKELGVSVSQLHSELDPIVRSAAFNAFVSGELNVICCVKVLDQGIDVPEVDLAIILATSRTRRQMIQRMGRILRLKEDGRVARFVLVYVRDTREDPLQGAHEEFFNELLEIAEDSRDFSLDSPIGDITDYLSP